MKTRTSYLAVATVLLLVAAACGSDDGGDGDGSENGATTTTAADTGSNNGGTTATTAAPEDNGDTPPDDQPDVGEAGSFTVNGTEFAVTLLNRCIPFFDSPGNIDLQALAQGAKLNLSQLGSETDVSVDGATMAEMFGSIAFGNDQVLSASDIGDDRWTGSASVFDALGSGDAVDVTWDVMIPDEVRDCSL